MRTPVLLLCEGCGSSQCQEGPCQGSKGQAQDQEFIVTPRTVDSAVYQQLKILENSKTVNVREVKSRKSFINCVILCLFAQNSSYLCLFTLLSHNVMQSQNGFYCVPFALKKIPLSICYNRSLLLFPSLLNKIIMDAWRHQGKETCGGTSSRKNNFYFIDEKRSKSLAKSHSSSEFAMESTVTAALSRNKTSV